MSREIKFKLWLTEPKKMTYAHDIFEIIHLGVDSYDGVVPLQFTGFHDKNGAELHEGDIIETKYDDKIEESGFGYVRNEIRFCEGAFCWIGETSGKPERLEGFDCKNSVVVGNIYENSELLK